MSALTIILDIVLILISLVLIVAVLMQQGQRQGLGAIAGGADTFFGKNKSKGIDAKLAKVTKIAAVVFIVLAIATTIVVTHNTTPAEAVSTDAAINELVEAVQKDVAANAAEETPAAEAEAPAEEPAAEAEAPAAEAEAPAEEPAA